MLPSPHMPSPRVQGTRYCRLVNPYRMRQMQTPNKHALVEICALFLSWPLEDGTDRLSRNVGRELQLYAA